MLLRFLLVVVKVLFWLLSSSLCCLLLLLFSPYSSWTNHPGGGAANMGLSLFVKANTVSLNDDERGKYIDLVVQTLEGLQLPTNTGSNSNAGISNSNSRTALTTTNTKQQQQTPPKFVSLKIMDENHGEHDITVPASILSSKESIRTHAELIVSQIEIQMNTKYASPGITDNRGFAAAKKTSSADNQAQDQQQVEAMAKAAKKAKEQHAAQQQAQAKNQKHPVHKKERQLLEKVLDAVTDIKNNNNTNTNSKKQQQQINSWFDSTKQNDHCQWKGITCQTTKIDGVHVQVVTRIELFGLQLTGTIPTILGSFRYLSALKLSKNELHGTIPTELEKCTLLSSIRLEENYLFGTIPKKLERLRELVLSDNVLSGPLKLAFSHNMQILDLSSNLFSGTIPKLFNSMTSLKFLFLGDNKLTGIIPNLERLTNLRTFDIAGNKLTNTNRVIGHRNKDRHHNNHNNHHHNAGSSILDPILSLSSNGNLWTLNLADNKYTGQIPENLFEFTNLQNIILSGNAFTGSIPTSYWEQMSNLSILMLDHNQFHGSLPVELLTHQANRLGLLDVSYNQLTGSIPTEIAKMTALHTIDAMGNRLSKSLPDEMMRMNPNLRLNFTDNLITGTIPSMFCGYGASSMNMLYREFGCDAVLCRPGTFNPHGHATLHSACRKCPTTDEGEQQTPKLSERLGRTTCDGMDFVHGDLDGDGILSPREILRMIYVDTLGRFWGQTFQSWADMKVNECDLLGITCVNGQVARIDLTSAEVCSNGDRRPGPPQYCKGLPSEIGELTALEVFQLTRRQFLRGSIPTEIGRLSLLRLLDISTCTSMTGTLPSEIGNMTNLKRLLVSHSRFSGTIASEIFGLRSLEKLHLTNNVFEGSLSSSINNLTNVKEFMISRNYFTGTIPTRIGGMTRLENLEAYHNSFTGQIPSELSSTSVKRIDVYSNKLSGSIPEEIASVQGLQIIHVKENQLTGTIPAAFGDLPYLSWFDVSQNYLTGTIPHTFSRTQSLEDFRLGGNMLEGKVPHGLCGNTKVNGGVAKEHRCEGIACSPGYYAAAGHAEDGKPCTKCPEGQMNLYLGSMLCNEMSEADILSVLFEVMEGPSWPPDKRKHWNEPDTPSCQWAGVQCDTNGEITSLNLPLVATDSS